MIIFIALPVTLLGPGGITVNTLDKVFFLMELRRRALTIYTV